MTVSSTDSIVAFLGNGVQAAFPCSFKVLEEAHVQVYVDGVLQVLNSDYTLSGVPGGSFTVTFTSAPADGAHVSVARVLPLVQETDYLENDEFPAETHERALDLLTMMVQQVAQGAAGKAIRFPAGDPAALTGILPVAASRAQKLLAFASDGDVVAVDGADLGAFSVGAQHIWTAQQIMQVAAGTDGWTLQDLSGNTLAKFRATAGTARGSLIVTDGAGNEGVIQAGAGDPEGVRGANPGTLFIRSDGGAGMTVYTKESGTGNTGWKPVGLAEPTRVSLAGNNSVAVTGIRLARRITIHFDNANSNGASAVGLELVIGTSAGVETSGYVGRRTELTNTAVGAVAGQSNAFGIHGNSNATDDFHGKIVLELVDSTTNRWWCQSWIFTAGGLARDYRYNGTKVLSGALDRFQIQWAGGADLFDAGTLGYVVE